MLSDANRSQVWAESMRGHVGNVGSLTKGDLRAAVDALDTFLDTNAATINAAIPQPARAGLTAKQKAVLLMLVVAKRYEVEV